MKEACPGWGPDPGRRDVAHMKLGHKIGHSRIGVRDGNLPPHPRVGWETGTLGNYIQLSYDTQPIISSRDVAEVALFRM